MKDERHPGKMFLYMLISVILPVGFILLNHMWRPNNILLSVILVTWMGFSLLVLQPFSVEGYETIEP